MRRTIEFKSLDDVLAEAERLRGSGYDRVGNWSLGQMCNHLAEEVDLLLAKPLQLVPRPMQKLMVGSFLQAAVVGKVGNALGLRLPTIKPQNQPIDDAAGVQRLRDSFQRLRQAGGEALIPFHLWHAAHHFSFLIPQRDPATTQAAAPANADAGAGPVPTEQA